MNLSRIAGCVLLVLSVAISRAGEIELSRTAAPMDTTDGLELTGAVEAVAEGPGGGKVLRFQDDFSGRIDLKALGIDPSAYDLIKVEIKADARARLRFSLENFPKPGELTHWYCLDTARGEFDWKTIWIDLRRPEEIKPPGTYKGLSENDPNLRGLRFDGGVADTKRSLQGPGSRVWLGRIRFCKKAVDLDWDQTTFRCEGGGDKDLVFTYPLTLTNRLDRAVTALVALRPFRVKEAKGSLSEEKVALAANETKTIEAKVSLPAAALKGKAPLYDELFEARAVAEGIDDSEVTVLRSSDPIHLSVTVPIPEERLKFPLLSRRKDLPEAVTGFGDRNRQECVAIADAVKPEDLNAALDGPLSTEWGNPKADRGLFGDAKNQEWAAAAGRYVRGLTACAFLYDCTGDKKHLEKGTALLLRAAELFPARRKEWLAAPIQLNSHGVVATNVLRLGWATGSMRSPYLIDRHGMFNDFDLLAADMDPAARQKIIDDFLVPAAVHMRNHYFGLTNQQDVINYAILYAGLVSRNWPLVSFACSSEHGVFNQIEWNFDDDGCCGEGNYHAPTVRPILYAVELLSRIGMSNLYDERLYNIVHSKGAEAIGKSFGDSIIPFLDEQRFPKELVAKMKAAPAGDGLHLGSGTTVLRWKGLQLAMNWGAQMNRGAPDRCSVRLAGPVPLSTIGGGNYTHSSLGQSIIIVDEGRQNTTRADVLACNISGPMQFVMARSDKHFAGTTITRTFAVIDSHALVVDRVTSDAARTVDWCLRYPGGGENTAEKLAKSLSVTLEEKAGSFTQKPTDRSHGVSFGGELKKHYSAATDAAWQEGQGRMTMAGEPGTELLAFAVGASFSASAKEKVTGVPVLMVRRRNVKQTDFITFFSKDTKSVERVPVKKADGADAQALGVKITLKDGKTIQAVVNYEPDGTEVVLGELKTKDRFATDFKAEATK